MALNKSSGQVKGNFLTPVNKIHKLTTKIAHVRRDLKLAFVKGDR